MGTVQRACEQEKQRKGEVGGESKGTIFFPFHLFLLNCSRSLFRAPLYYRNAWNRLNFVNIARAKKEKPVLKETVVGTANSAFL